MAESAADSASLGLRSVDGRHDATDVPVLVEIGAGVLGALVTVPSGPPRASAVIFPGHGASRAGNNQMWSRLARQLADDGVVTLRADYPGEAESHGAPRTTMFDSLTGVLDWFADRTGPLDLLVISSCFGAAPAARVASASDHTRAIAFINPALLAEEELASLRSRPRSVPRRLLDAARHLRSRCRRLVRSVELRARYGRPAHIEESGDASALEALDETIRRIAQRVPVWCLTGKDDRSAGEVVRLAEELPIGARLEIEVVDGAIASSPDPETQDLVLDRTRAWVRRCLEPVETE